MSYLDWHVGMKVVCIEMNVRNADVRLFPDLPQKGRVYTVSRITTAFTGEIGIQLREVNTPIVGRKHKKQGLFPARWFRPVQKRKSDISIFTAMLNDQRSKVPA